MYYVCKFHSFFSKTERPAMMNIYQTTSVRWVTGVKKVYLLKNEHLKEKCIFYFISCSS